MSKVIPPINPALAPTQAPNPAPLDPAWEALRGSAPKLPRPPAVPPSAPAPVVAVLPFEVGNLDGDPSAVQDAHEGAPRDRPRESTQMSVNVSGDPSVPILSNEDFLDTTPPPPPLPVTPAPGEPGDFAGSLSFESSRLERHGAEARIEGQRQIIADLPLTAADFRDRGLDIAKAAGALAAANECSIVEVLDEFAELASAIAGGGFELGVFESLHAFLQFLRSARLALPRAPHISLSFGTPSDPPPPDLGRSHHKPPQNPAPKPPAPPKATPSKPPNAQGPTGAARALAAANAQAEKERLAREKAAAKEREAKLKELRGRVKLLSPVPGTEKLVAQCQKEIEALEKGASKGPKPK